jgi:uncharacterized membrane protein
VNRLQPGDLLAGLAGALLLGSLFAPWYAPTDDSAELSGWQAFAVIDILLALAALLGIALAVVTAARRTPTLPVALSVLGVPVGALATLLVLVRIVNQPGANDAVAVSYGAWLALAGTVALTAGAWWATADERSRGVPAPHVEVRPAPPPGPAAS